VSDLCGLFNVLVILFILSLVIIIYVKNYVESQNEKIEEKIRNNSKASEKIEKVQKVSLNPAIKNPQSAALSESLGKDSIKIKELQFEEIKSCGIENTNLIFTLSSVKFNKLIIFFYTDFKNRF
jgi:hypothetical protein